ncbi:MAG: alpha/beta hydrolase-fold protein [Polyangiaceae bacterium]
MPPPPFRCYPPGTLFVDPALPRTVFGWHSSRLGIDMPIVSYGDWGHPLLVFPTAQADFLENERFYLIKAIEKHILAGKVRVFSIDSINKHAWMNRSVPIRESARRQALYASYVEEEVVPFIRDAVSNDAARIAVTGASFGAFHAANQFFRRPDLFDALIAMSGFYDLDPDYTHGYADDNVYFNNPVAYLANLHDAAKLHLLQHSQIHIVTGRGRWEAPHRSEQLAEVLRQKGIPHNLDMWGRDVDHDWPWWRKMLDHYIGERLGW